VRVIAARTRTWSSACATAPSAEDLFSPVNVIRLRLPSLRERAKTYFIVKHFLSRQRAAARRRAEGLAARRCSTCRGSSCRQRPRWKPVSLADVMASGAGDRVGDLRRSFRDQPPPSPRTGSRRSTGADAGSRAQRESAMICPAVRAHVISKALRQPAAGASKRANL